VTEKTKRPGRCPRLVTYTTTPSQNRHMEHLLHLQWLFVHPRFEPHRVSHPTSGETWRACSCMHTMASQMRTSCALHDATPLVFCLTATDRGSCHNTSNFINSTSVQQHNDHRSLTQGSRTFHFVITMRFNHQLPL
jgi:hypothetical protein